MTLACLILGGEETGLSLHVGLGRGLGVPLLAYIIRLLTLTLALARLPTLTLARLLTLTLHATFRVHIFRRTVRTTGGLLVREHALLYWRRLRRQGLRTPNLELLHPHFISCNSWKSGIICSQKAIKVPNP